MVNAEVSKLLATADLQAAVHAQCGETQVMTPGQFSALLKTEHDKWRGIVKASGATLEQGRRGRAVKQAAGRKSVGRKPHPCRQLRAVA